MPDDFDIKEDEAGVLPDDIFADDDIDEEEGEEKKVVPAVIDEEEEEDDEEDLAPEILEFGDAYEE